MRPTDSEVSVSVKLFAVELSAIVEGLSSSECDQNGFLNTGAFATRRKIQRRAREFNSRLKYLQYFRSREKPILRVPTYEQSDLCDLILGPFDIGIISGTLETLILDIHI
jgi:hypothetical protein